MRWNAVVIVYALVTLFTLGESRVFDLCTLARELSNLGAVYGELPSWVCIAYEESRYDTSAIGPPNTDGSRDHGIFQINDRYWCRSLDGSNSYNGCHVDCSQLRTDNIGAAFRCSQKVLREQGWCAWSTWRKCKNNLENYQVDHCF